MADIDNNGDKELAQSPQSDINSSLRQRKKKSTSKTVSYRINNTKEQGNNLSSAQEHTFLNMYIRKSQRRIHGKQSNKTLIGEFIFVVILVIITIILGWDNEEGDWQADTVGVVVILLWVIFALCIFFVWGKGPYAKMLRYMVVYLPLLLGVATQSFYEEVRNTADPPPVWSMIILLICLEVLVFVGFMSYYTFMPKILHSEWLRKNGRIQWLWSIEPKIEGDAWTMKYRAHNPIRRGLFKCKMNYMCQYKGNIDSETGLPNGMGRWIDDAYDGEMLTGYFKEGHPVAPFSSWTVGRSEDAVTAVRIGYFKATDDVFSKNKLVPTNDNLPECGVASVECSISGNFYKHLPSATLIEGPSVVESMPTAHTNPVRNMLSHLFQLCEEDKCTGNQIDIRTDARGIYIPGFVYEPTGRHHSPDTKSIRVDVEWGRATDERHLSAQASTRTLQRTLFMPKAASSEPLSKIVECEVDDSDDDEDSDDEEMNGGVTQSQSNSDSQQTATLRIQNWIPIKHKEALVFFPGYNCRKVRVCIVLSCTYVCSM